MVWIINVLVTTTILAACNKQPAVDPLKANVAPVSVKQSKTPEPSVVQIEPKSAVVSTAPVTPVAESLTDANAWVGVWKWEKSDKYNTSTMEIKSINNQQVTFSLNAFHVTNQKSMGGHNGNIENGLAILNGNEAVFKDEEFKFELRMSIVDKHLMISTNNSDYFGAFVVVDGSYIRSRSSFAESKSDYLIVPGKSIGKIALGMAKDEVTRLLGKPTNSDENQMTYKSSKNYINLLLNNQVVKQIEFTSPSFSTSEGINTGNFDEKIDLFNVFEFQWRFLQIRYELKQGGLAFFTFNAGVPDDNTEYQQYAKGYIYDGQQIYEEPISGAKWKPVP
jgi:hypothetical protein